MAKRGGLGRGLDALIPNKKPEKTEKPEKSEKKSKTAESKVSKKSAVKSADSVTKSEDKENRKNVIPDEEERMFDSKSKAELKKFNETREYDASFDDDEELEPDMLSETSDISEEADPEENRSSAEKSVDTEMTPEQEVSEAKEGTKNTEESESEEIAENISSIEATGDSFDVLNSVQSDAEAQVINMRISYVEPNRDQPRKYFDEAAIDELADSIRQFGIISPLLVQRKNDYYEIIAGERRWRAAKKAGLKEVPVIVRDFSSQEAVEVSLIENIQREDLNPIEEAKAYNRLVAEYGLKQDEVAVRVSKSRSAVANSLRLLKLADEVQKMLETGELSEGHARTLISLESPALQLSAAQQVIKEHLSVRQTEKLVKDLLNPTSRPKKSADEVRIALLETLSENLKAALGTKVNIHQNGKQKGRIEIEFYSDDELDRLYELLRAIG